MSDARVLPHSLDAERSLLGAVLIDNSVLDEIVERVYPVDFYREAHAEIFRAMLALTDRREPIDFVSLKDALARAGRLDAIGGPVYLSALVDGLPHETNVGYYAKIVREKATLREIIFASQKAIARAYEQGEDAAAVLDTVQQDIFAIAAQSSDRGLVPMPDLVHEIFPILEALHANRGPVTGVPSGLVDLDYLTCGWQKGNLILIGARPSMGKTALALNAAYFAATQARRNVGIFSLEMSKIELGFRMLCAEAEINGHRLRTGQIWDAEWPRISEALGRMSEARLHIDDLMGISLNQMRARCRKMKAHVGLDLVIVDYLQLMESTRRSENRTLELAQLSRQLKGMAKDLDVPVIALSQLSRSLESRADKRPLLSDLRESGSLEQDADVVIFIYRDEVYDPESPDKGIAELILSKQRNGPSGIVARVVYRPELMKFANLTDRHHSSVVNVGG